MKGAKNHDARMATMRFSSVYPHYVTKVQKKGRTVEEARDLSAAELSAPLGPLPPMKIHCGQMVEGALRAALDGGAGAAQMPAGGAVSAPGLTGNLAESLGEASGMKPAKLKVVLS